MFSQILKCIFIHTNYMMVFYIHEQTIKIKNRVNNSFFLNNHS